VAGCASWRARVGDMDLTQTDIETLFQVPLPIKVIATDDTIL